MIWFPFTNCFVSLLCNSVLLQLFCWFIWLFICVCTEYCFFVSLKTFFFIKSDLNWNPYVTESCVISTFDEFFLFLLKTLSLGNPSNAKVNLSYSIPRVMKLKRKFKNCRLSEILKDIRNIWKTDWKTYYFIIVL